MDMKKAISLCMALALAATLACGCAQQGDITADGQTDSGDSGAASAVSGAVLYTDADMFTERDGRSTWDEGGSTHITLEGDTAAADGGSVTVDGSVVTITGEGTYILSGTLADGRVVVDAGDGDKVQLVLAGVSVTSSSSAALYIRQADKVFVTLAEGTENALANGGDFTAVDENNIDGAVFAKDDLTINGSGSLTVTSPAGHGIVCKDDLVLTGGVYTIRAAGHGLEANDSVRLTGAVQLTVDAGKDGIHCENDEDETLGFVYISGGTLELEAAGDGISAGGWMQLMDGSFTILAGGGSVNGSKESSDGWGGFMGRKPGDRGGAAGTMAAADASDGDSTSMKGVKAADTLYIAGGTFEIDSADDCIHSDGSITIAGGSFTMASGDDGVHADDTLTVTDCDMEITESYEGLEALHLRISGGSIRLAADDDGLNAAGGADSSGTTGGRDGMFGGWGGGMHGASDGTIVISGGELYIKAYGDGIDANGTLEISGGHIVVVGPTQGDTATLDYDVSGIITGGTFIGTGASGMAQSFSSSQQGVIALSVGTQDAGTKIVLADAEGHTIVEHTPELDFAVVIISTPEMVSGETYSVTVGSSSGEFTAK